MSKSTYYFDKIYFFTQKNSAQDFESFEATTNLYCLPISLLQMYKSFSYHQEKML